jgi:hypothetical protein
MIVYVGYFLIVLFLAAIYNRSKIKKVYSLYSIFKNTVDPENKKNCCQITYDICKVFYMLCFPPKPPERFNKKLIKVPYKYRENKYVYLLKVPKGSFYIESITDENGNDVKVDIEPYLGPNLDCHNEEVFPRDFGLKKLIIKDSNDIISTFEENEKIVLNKSKLD